jgi:hypothetical protein
MRYIFNRLNGSLDVHLSISSPAAQHHEVEGEKIIMIIQTVHAADGIGNLQLSKPDAR